MTEPEPKDLGGSPGEWWSWLSTAREKSMSALNATKRDLAEFVTVLGTDTKKAVSGASANIKGILQQPDSSGKSTSSSEQSSSRAASSSIAKEIPAPPYDRCQSQLFALQNSTDTYLTDPNGGEKAFLEWKSGFDVQARQPEISNLLVSCSHIRSLHAKLVPSQVSYESFWQRYFYKVQLLQQEEERRAELVARAKPRAETWHWDEDVEEVSSAVSATKSASDHHRSDSSDSFICVTEDPSEAEDKPQETADTDSWVSISQEPQENTSDPSKPDSPDDQVEKLDKPEDLLAELEKLDLPGEEVDKPDCPDDSGSSDWEKWDD